MLTFGGVIGLITLLGGYRVEGWGSAAVAAEALGLLVAGAVTEELIFRGLLFQWLRGWIGPIGAAVISAALFGALHWPSGQAVWAGLVGFALALLFNRMGSLWSSVAAHAGNNAMAILLVLTLAEVGYAFLSLPKFWLALGLIVMAVWKALLVALFYMHLRWEPKRLWVLAASPLPLIAILILAVLMEY